MKIRRHLFLPAVAAAAAIVGVATPAARAADSRPDEPGELGGTSETFTDVREDGTYFDSSLGRRVPLSLSITIVEPSAFDWSDAGVGAAGAVGLTLLAGGVVIVSRHSKQSAA